MSTKINLSVSPYYDTFDSSDSYHQILFKPATAVQVRELNELQRILQHQIEEFGDHILARGTLLDGCQMTFNSSIPFIKIEDVNSLGVAIDVKNYHGDVIRDMGTGLAALIINSVDGFESQDPDLKTFYLRYLNSGNSGNLRAFSEGSNLRIHSRNYSLNRVEVTAPSSGFSNTDTLVIMSAVEIVKDGGDLNFTAGQEPAVNDIYQSTVTPTKQFQVLEYADGILRIKPLDADLSSTGDPENYNISVDETFIRVSPSVGTENIRIIKKIGSGAHGKIVTRTGGAIETIKLYDKGFDYKIEPFVSIKSRSATTANISQLTLAGRNYKSDVTIPNSNGSTGINNPTVGVGYSMKTSSGVVYQNGYFLKAPEQVIIVSKYANNQSDVAVGFVSKEEIITSDVDSSLVDNASGFLNENAPGADRLKITAVLEVRDLTDAEDDPNFTPIVKFSEGRPYSQMTSAKYNRLGDELAQRTYEESGNYVLDRFQMTTASATSLANADTKFNYLIDPGHAYINGYRVKTVQNYAKEVNKATSTITANTSMDAAYGNYVVVDELLGTFDFASGGTVTLYDIATNAVTRGTQSLTSEGSNIGTAKVRSMIHVTGNRGMPSAKYRLYLFDIRMNRGKRFSQVRTIASSTGIADVVLSQSGDAVIQESARNSLIYSFNKPAKSISNLTYKYRSTQTNRTVTAGGLIDVVGDSNAVWPYSESLTTNELKELHIVPEVTIVAEEIDDSPTITATGNGTYLVTSGGDPSTFTNTPKVGYHIQVNSKISVITKIHSSTQFEIVGAITNADSGACNRVFPANTPIMIVDQDGNNMISANIITGSPGTLRIDLNTTTSTVTPSVTVSYNQLVNSALSTKVANRNKFVKIDLTQPNMSVLGPWCLGVSDVFRMRSVMLNGTTDVTNDFYVDSGNRLNYIGNAYLVLKPKSKLVLDNTMVLTVEFDYFTTTMTGSAAKTVSSYTVADNIAFGSLTSNINTIEIPEMTDVGVYYDLRECIDFRPIVANTVTPGDTEGVAPTNPSIGSTLVAGDKRFPVPDGDVDFTVEYYIPRKDIITVNSDGKFEFFSDRKNFKAEKNMMVLYDVDVPEYPSLPERLSSNMSSLITKNIDGFDIESPRRKKYTIVSKSVDVQTEGYTMSEIASLERRIAALEYYAQLSETANEVKDLVITSSIDSTIERFKYGFFVDNFADYSLSNRNNPEYAATIYEFVLQPDSSTISLQYVPTPETEEFLYGDRIQFKYDRAVLTKQPYATVGPVEIVGTEGPPVLPPWSMVCQTIRNRNERKSWGSPTRGEAYSREFEVNTFTLAENPDAAGSVIKILRHDHLKRDYVTIYQTNDPFTYGTSNIVYRDAANVIVNSNVLLNQSAINSNYKSTLNDLEKTTLMDNMPRRWPSLNSMGNFSNRAFKIEIPYNPARGKYLVVETFKASEFFAYYICYPANALEDPMYDRLYENYQRPRQADCLTIDGPQFSSAAAAQEWVANQPPEEEWYVQTYLRRSGNNGTPG